MKNLEELIDRQTAERNPGEQLGRFLLAHSNSAEYLVSQLEAYLEAARADLQRERDMFARLTFLRNSK